MIQLYEYQRGDFLISTDKSKLQMDVIDDYLRNQSYWGGERPRELTEIGVQNSLCYGMYDGQGAQVCFARLVTDYATFAWLCDVFILPSHQGSGLGKWLVKTIYLHPAIKDIHISILATRDAHELYHRYAGFTKQSNPEKWLERIIDQRQ
jgi:GNAT superfamily N-acetyltransferase